MKPSCSRRLNPLFALAAVIALLPAGCSPAGAPQPVTVYPTWVPEVEPVYPAPGLHAGADPRIELLAVVQWLSGYDRRTNLLTDYDFPYRRRVAETFAPYREHAAVKLFDRMSQANFAFDAPPALMIHLTPPPELAVQAPFNQEVMYRAGGPEKIDEFLAALRDFAVESDFMAFYEASRPDYAAMTAAVEAVVSPADLAALEDYYGLSQASYNLVLAPLFHGGGFGPRVERGDGRFDLYSITGPQGVEGDLPVFGTRESYRSLIWHEFSHSFVNPQTARHAELIAPYESKLMPPIKAEMSRQAYSSWDTIVNEHIVRAVTSRLATLVEGQAAGQQALDYERGRGFAYVDALYARLAEYEQDRDQYPTFADFYPRLVEVFEEEAGSR